VAPLDQQFITVLTAPTLTDVLGQIVRKRLSVQFHIPAVVDIDQVLARTKAVPKSGQSEIDGFVVSPAMLGIAVSQPDQSVDIEAVRLVLPGGDGEEGADNVAVDGQKLISVRPLHSGNIDEAGLGEVVPVLLPEAVVHKAVNVISIPLTSGRQPVVGQRGVASLLHFEVPARSVSKGQSQESHEDDELHSH